jgi:hypothetical protein
MSDTATRATEALNELQTELDHADTLITEQQNRILFLEHVVRDLATALSIYQGAA